MAKHRQDTQINETMKRTISRREAIRRGLIATPGLLLAARMGLAGSVLRNSDRPFPVENSEVRMHRGAPTLFVNGQPNTAFTFFYCNMEGCGEDIRDFAKAGIDLFSGCGIYTFKPDGTLDFDALGEELEYVISQNPNVLILPRTGVHTVGKKHPWYEQYGDEMQRTIDPDTGKTNKEGVFSMSSKVWLEEITPLLADIVQFSEKHFGKHILGYHVHGGATGEWSYNWSRNSLSDYSAPQQQAFRQWLREKYRNEAQALREAWNQPDISFETAEIPMDRRRAYWQDVLFYPDKDQASIDYMYFHSKAMAKALLHCAGIVKRTLAGLHKNKICGAFYGYHFKRFNRPGNLFNQGHYAGDLVLQSEDIDFVCAPYNYSGRESGHMYSSQLAPGSVRLHNKLFWCEEDTVTYLVPEGTSHFHRNPDRFTSIETLKRNTMGVLREGGTLWYMDLYQRGAFRDEKIMMNLARLQEIARERLAQADLSSAAQVAVFVSDASKSYIRQDESLMDALVFKQLYELGALGCPFDVYRVEDLSHLSRQPWLNQYRLMIFLDAIYISEGDRKIIDESLKKDGRTLLWMYGPGMMTEEGLSVEAVEALTSFKVGLQKNAGELRANSVLNGTKVWYGDTHAVKPIPYGADPEAEVLGWYLDTALPALMIRDWGQWRSVWSGAPALPAAELRTLARQAGVHLYVETGDQVIAEKNYLTVHAGFDGEREIKLPAARKVMDAMTGEVIAVDADRFKVEMRKGQTGIWRLLEAV